MAVAGCTLLRAPAEDAYIGPTAQDEIRLADTDTPRAASVEPVAAASEHAGGAEGAAGAAAPARVEPSSGGDEGGAASDTDEAPAGAAADEPSSGGEAADDEADAGDVGTAIERFRPPAPTKLGEEHALPLTIDHARLLVLENNQSLVVERLRPPIAATLEDVEAGVFDPLVTAEIGRHRSQGELLNAEGDRQHTFDTDGVLGSAAIEHRLPTGTAVRLEAGSEIDDEGDIRQLVRSRIGLMVSQSLLRGAKRQANLARVHQARIDALASQYQLRGFAQALLAEVENAYWDCVLAKLQLEIADRAKRAAEARLKATVKRIEAGTLSESERVAAEAAVAQREQRRRNADSQVEVTRLRLLRLLNPPCTQKWQRDVVVERPPLVPNTPLDDVEEHVAVALGARPDLNHARLQVRRGDLEVVRTRDGLLPVVDLFATAGKSGYAEGVGESWKNLDSNDYDMFLGVRTQFPLRNRSARAQYKQAMLSREQTVEALANLEQLIQMEVRTAFEEVRRATNQIEATRITLDLRKRAYENEVERLKIGRSTTLDVVRAHRDLLDSQDAVAEAKIDYLKAVVNLFRVDGSLLDRRGVEAPGTAPVEPVPECGRCRGTARGPPAGRRTQTASRGRGCPGTIADRFARGEPPWNHPGAGQRQIRHI
jgi:outer membrane protein TolC